MKKFISTSWIGRDTIEVEKYIKETGPELANSINNFIYSTFGASGVQLTGIDAVRKIKDVIIQDSFGLLAPATKQSLDSLISSVTNMFTYPNVVEPIACLTGIYYKKDLTLNNKYETEQDTGIVYVWPFSSFSTVSYGTSKINSTNKETLFSLYEQDIDVIFNYEQFKTFVKIYLYPLSSEILNDEGSLKSIYCLFVYTFKKILEESSKRRDKKFVNFEREMLSETKQEEGSIFNYSLTSEYNFYIKQYEQKFTKDYNLFQILPNYYLLNSYLYTNEEQKIKNIITLNEKINTSERSVLEQDYYTNFVNQTDKMSTDELLAIVNKAKNYSLDTDYANTTKLTLSDEMLPYNNKLVFSNDKSDQISSFLNENNLQNYFVTNIYTSLVNSPQSNLANISGDFENIKGKYSLINYSNYVDTIKYNYSNLNSEIGFTVLPSKNEDFISLTNNKNSNTKGYQSIFPFIKLQNLLLQTFNDNLEFKSLFNCKSNKSFSCGYTVDKVNPQNKLGKTYQNIVFARDNNIMEYEFVDTQVVYDSEMGYSVFSFELTPSNEYYYSILSDDISLINIGDSPLNTLKLRGFLSSQLSFYKTPLFFSSTRVLDNPPLPVDVNIVPFVGVNNALRFLFNTQFGSYREKPIIILDEDEQIFNNIKNSRNNTTDKIFFETDDFISNIQIFRTTTQPSSYSDFKNSLYLTLNMNSLTANSLIELLSPNQKYYYIFRSVDVHNNISNPSSVFEVEIIDNNGAIYPIIRTVPFIDKERYEISRSFRKYINITPSVTQTAFIPNEDNTQVTFGERQDLWNQKFKLRFTSKKTGKCFDLNLTFVKE